MGTAIADVNSVETSTTNPLLEVPIVEEKKTYSRVIFQKNVEGKDPEFSAKVMSQEDADATVKDFNEALAAFNEKKEGAKKPEFDAVTVDLSQTFGFDHAHTLDAAQEIFGGNVKELCKQLNNAVDVKLGNRVRSIMLATEEDGSFTFSGAEGTYSMRKYIGEETAARGKTDFQKTLTLAGKLSPDQRKALLALLQSDEAGQ